MNPSLSSLCVFCGSRIGSLPVFRETAAQLGRLLAENDVRLIYGGGRIGLMGIIADAALAAGGHVTGVIPNFLERREAGHWNIDELIVTDSMHERKQRMFDLADGFVVLPGGLGTLDETIEIMTWKQLEQHDKPIILVDIAGHWRPLLGLFDAVIANGFAGEPIRDLYTVVDRVEDVLPAASRTPLTDRGSSAGL